jgi:hypothetical protein
MKGIILPDHIPVNNYQMIVVGGPPIITFTSIDGLEEELETVDLPDRTVASGGNTKSMEFTAQHPKHHTVEDAFLESWFLMSQDPVLPVYKKAATLLIQSISRLQTRTYNLIGLFPSKRKTADLEMNNEGELNVTEWTFKCDRLIPV